MWLYLKTVMYLPEIKEVAFMEVFRKDKERLMFFSNEVLSILGEYEETLADERFANAKYFALHLKACVEAFETADEIKEQKVQYRCYVTEEPIKITDCNTCKTQSCPINTGFATTPERIDE